ncbi:hypothetical protein [Hyphobacterium indicum]|uniref:hypothetical protein n=1 Tax=Hyphobacterium indicum TaxID=2162714 RepID=UPI000D654873|nr:hypothetical protein [Hyphobacterium indicum]
MILARLSRAIRQQNWFAVVLEFVIVIAGVVIGFQITAWNAARAERSTEAEIMARLHNDIASVGNVRWDWAADRTATRELLLSASHKLFGDDLSDLSPSECNALAQSHVFNSPSLALPILAELESTGDLDLIRSERIRTAVTANFLATAWSSEMDTALNHEVFNLSARHSDYFYFVVPDDADNWNPIFDGSARCDTDGMRNDRRFLNELADNISKSGFFEFAVLSGPNDSFLALHEAVDVELGIVHEEEAP